MSIKDLIQRARELSALAEKATPGPWYSIPNPEWKNACCRIDNKPDADWGNFGQISYASPHDAPLIAAAPEMAELLKQLADELDANMKADAQINEALNMGDGVYRP